MDRTANTTTIRVSEFTKNMLKLIQQYQESNVGHRDSCEEIIQKLISQDVEMLRYARQAQAELS